MFCVRPVDGGKGSRGENVPFVAGFPDLENPASLKIDLANGTLL
jgi:hypothetical protein